MRIRAIAIASCCACGPAPRSNDTVDAKLHADAATEPIDAPAPKLYVYAHTASALYRVEPDTLAITLVGNFQWPTTPDSMTDIAIDKTGRIIGVSFSSVYLVDPATAKTTLLSSSLGGTFNGLSFVPATNVGLSGDDVLVGTRNSDGNVSRVDAMTGTTTMVGDMGTGFTSSGDLVAVDGFGIVQTTPGMTSDVLVTLAPNTFAATPIGTGTGFSSIWGVAYWKQKIFGFTANGEFITIDPTTGVGTLVQGNGPTWWGAAVTTVAPVVE